MRSQMFYNIDVFEIFLKSDRKPDPLDSGTDVFLSLQTFFTLNKYYCGKIAPVLKS